MQDTCDVCGETENVQSEIFVKGEDIDRIYHLCPVHWVEVYRRTLDDFVEGNQYKAVSYIKMVADKLIVDAQHADKAKDYVDEEGVLDPNAIGAKEVRMLRPYSNDGEDGDYE